MADQDHGGAQLVLHATDRLHHLALYHHVERTGRLVGDDHLGAQENRNGDTDALLHAAAQLVGKHVGDCRLQINPLQYLRNAQPFFAAAQLHIVGAHGVNHLAANAYDWVE